MRSLLATFGLLLVLGCSSTPPPPPPTAAGSAPSAPPSGLTGAPPSPAGSLIAKTPACELIFKSEAASAIGVPIELSQEESAESDSEGWFSECVYYRQASFDQAPLDVTIASGARYRALFDDLEAQPGSLARPDLGDEAFLRMSTIAGLNGPIGALFVRLGETLLGLSLGIVDLTDDGGMTLVGDASGQEQILDGLAALAINRLTGPPEPATQTCQLLAVADASAITGDVLTAAEDVDEHDLLGPTCHYKGANDRVALLISVNSAQIARDHFDQCRSNGRIVLGVGDAAFLGRQDCSAVMVNYFPLEPVLYVRAGETIITVGQFSANNTNDSAEPVAAVAREVLGQLGLNVGATPAPVAAKVIAHACLLATPAEVQSVIGEPITSTYERDPNQNAGISDCEYHASEDGRYVPLDLSLKTGQAALGEWSTYHTYDKGDKVAVTGLGDEAFSEEVAGYDESQPTLVNLYVLSGQAELILRMGIARQSADYLTYLAVGTPEQQLAMLKQLASSILPRLTAPPG